MKALGFLLFCGFLSLNVLAQSGPPALCKPCLFYGGDFDPTDINSYALSDENTSTYPNTSTYAAIVVPSKHAVLIEGILFQIQFDNIVKLDPNGVSWVIRSGVSEGNGGTVVASGQGFAVLQPTGRGDAGPEYTVAVKVNPAVTLNGGVYWFNVTPQCTNPHDPVCSTNQYGVSNTTQRANSLNGSLQVLGQMFVDSQAFNYNWKNWCDLLDQPACAYLYFWINGQSFALVLS